MARPRKNGPGNRAPLKPEDVAEIPVEEQPYPLPKGWKWVRVGDCNCYVGEIINPALFGQKTFELYSVPSSSNNFPEIILGEEIGSSKQIVEKDDILLCKINPRINRVWRVAGHTNNSLIASSEWIIFRNKNILSKYMMYCMQSQYFRQYMLSNVSGVGGSLMRAKPKYVRNYPIPLPPHGVQERIVHHIESLFAKLDEAKEQAEAVLDGFETRKAAILYKAFTGELTKTWRSEHGHTKEEWQKLTLNDVAKWGSGGTPSRKLPDYYAGDIAWVKTGELNNEYLYETEEHITKDAIKNSSAKIFPKETVIIAMYGATIGQCAILGIDAATNQACACAIVKQNTYNKFLFNYLISQKNNFINLGKGGAQPNISQAIIKEYPISLPSLPEQQEIVRILDTLLSKEHQIKDAAETVLEEIGLIKKSILARAFRGELY